MRSLCELEHPFEMPFDIVVDLGSVGLCRCRMCNRIQVLVDVEEKPNLPAALCSEEYAI